jgi:NAD(P)-dependent dehydrogenase (short-subunit alcohol dehydrogenase family)
MDAIADQVRSLTELLSLSGRRALVTGGAGRIGRVVIEGLLELGASVALLDLDEDVCRTCASELSFAHPDRVIPISCDLTEEAATRSAVHQVVEQWHGLDIIVHCAAYVGTSKHPGWAVPFPMQTVNAWDAALRVNLTSAFVLAQEAEALLAVSGRGAICLIGSIYGLVGPDMRLYDGTTLTNPAGYGAGKGGVLQLTKYLATVLAPTVRVNCVSPGGIFRQQPAEFVQRYEERTPLQRMGREEDLKGAVGYLVSDASAYVTGHNLVVDGGWTAW